MVRVRFGEFLDGTGSLSPPARLGDVDLGPAGFMALLETHLGLGGIWPSAAERSLLYHAALKRTIDSTRFYAASFDTDELGASAELLRWRDALYLNGWNGQPSACFGARLADLASVEAQVDPDLRCSPGERLRRIDEALGKRRVPVTSLLVVEPRQSFPTAWRRVLDGLSAAYATSMGPAATNSLLAEVQGGLCSLFEGRPVGPIAWRHDESVRIVRAETRLLAGRWFAEATRSPQGSKLILAESHSEVLDHLLESAGMARHGFADTSAFRPSLQVLPLALSLIWEPLDIYAALEFLSHPICPIPRFARERFAERLSSRPGLQRDDFSKVFDKVRTHYGELADEMIGRIDAWLFQARYSPDDGASLADVAARVDSLRSVFARRIGTAHPDAQPAFIAAHHQCEAVAKGLRQFLAAGELRIGQIQLRKLVSQATSAGSANPLRIPQLGCAAFAGAPGAVIDSVDSVYWWQLGMPPMPTSAPWTRAERRQLSEAGVVLLPIAERLRAATRAWLRPILAARRQLTLVLPPESEEVHPVWQLLKQVIPNVAVRPLESLLVGPDPGLSVGPIQHQLLPSRRRWWTLPKGIAPSRSERSSFTALDQYLNNPFQWVLEYGVRLKGSRIHSVPDEFTLSGNVTHRVVQKLFEEPDALHRSKADLRAWAEATLDQVLRSEAAVLLLPGQRAAERRLRDTVANAVSDLCEQIRSAGATHVEPERGMEGTFVGGKLVGSADLVLTFATGEQAIVDLKWAGVKKYPEKLTANRHLQLMIYGGLLQQATTRWPRYAYYLLKDMRLLAHDREIFSNARVCAAVEPQTLPQLWKRIETTWTWRCAQLEDGRIEVAMEGIEADSASIPPAGALGLEVLSPTYNPFLNLAGWES